MSQTSGASSKPSPEEVPSPVPDEPIPLPSFEQPTSEAAANEQNAFVLRWMKARGYQAAAKIFEDEVKSGKAGTDPIVIAHEPGSGSDGEGAGADSKQATKRRASARLAKQVQKDTIGAQELVQKVAPKGAVAATTSAPSATQSKTTGAKTGRAKSPGASAAIKSPLTATATSGLPSKQATTSTLALASTSKASVPSSKSPAPAATTTTGVTSPDLSQLYTLLSSIVSTNLPASTSTASSAATTANLYAALSRAGMSITEAMARDPSDRQQGYKDLERWVEGALDMYRPEFRPILFPVFVHLYLELVLEGFKDAAAAFFETYSPALLPSHNAVLHRLSTITLPHHVNEDEMAQRFRSEKYLVRMSRSGFGLLIGWLMEGSGGEAMGVGEGFGGDSNKRGRAAVRRVINDRIDIDVTTASSTEVPPSTWEENIGLLSSLIPSTSADGVSSTTTAPKTLPSTTSFNQSRGQVKLGPAPLPEGLQDETDRMLAEEAEADPTGMGGMNGDTGPSSKPRRTVASHEAALIAPALADLPPKPPTFKIMDVRREVEKVRDARKRIRLEPATLSATDVEQGLDRAALFAKASALPSVCCYTFHEAANDVCSSTFSPDYSLMAAGFSESYIRLWSLKGEKLRGMRSDFAASSIKDAKSAKKLREKHGSTTRKLIAHSAPVYSLSFDPLAGTAGTPKYLLSASADATTRLWSLDTMSNIVVYRGHQNPVWDVEWSPMGIYFATGSRDRTARLWSTDRTTALRIFAGHLSDVDCVRFHPNSLYLATGSSDTSCRLWDVQRGVCMRVFLGHQGAITSMAMSPCGRYLASSATDLAINLWDLGSGRRIKKMTGHTSLINSISFSACSSMLVSGSSDWTVRCWDVKGPGGPRSKKGVKEDVEVDGFGLASRGSLVGLGGAATREDGKLPEGGEHEEIQKPLNETIDLISTFHTKRTPIMNVHFTPRNLCLVSGSYLPLQDSNPSM